MFKSFVVIAMFCICTLHTLSTAGEIITIGSAADNVIVVVIETQPKEAAPEQNTAEWLIDGEPADSVGRWSYVWYVERAQSGTWPAIQRHHMYLMMSEKLVNGKQYELTTPYGTHTLNFDDQQTFCECIKVNQEGYFAKSTVRYANLGIYMGDLGARSFDELPNYKVIDENSGDIVLQGQVQYWGDDTDPSLTEKKNLGSGEYVYRIDLADVAAGGPYFVSVAGLGRSHPFGIGKAFTQKISFVHTRGLYHQRCGIALDAEHTPFTRDACHTTVEITDAAPSGFIQDRGEEMEIHGGYHDAGDFDRRLTHILIPAWMLNLYGAFPENFSDNQFDLPESGNGIPDWLDEALWGTLVWEYLQTESGAVRGGTEANRHPEYAGVNAATDALVYRTYGIYGHTTAIAAGLFAHAARLLKPFDATRADSLQNRAIKAWEYLQAHDMPTALPAQRMYAALQLYLLTAEPAFHDQFITHAAYLLNNAGWPQQYHQVWWNLNTISQGMIFSPYFFDYLTTDLPVAQDIYDGFYQKLKNKADGLLNTLNNQPYPLGDARGLAWGTATNQGRYAEPMLLMYRLTGDNKYLDGISQLADYTLGLNPLGKSYVTGLGANPPNNPCHLDSYFTFQKDGRNVPGIVVYGPVQSPSGADWERAVWEKVYPQWETLPQQRRYSDGWSFIGANEFTVWETMALNVCMHGFLNSFYTPDTTLSEVGIFNQDNSLNEFELLQNYPNPFNGHTIINYTIPNDAFVEISIFNAMGQHINTLVQEQQTAGKQKIHWNGRNEQGDKIASGLYYATIRVINAKATLTATQKMIFLR